jgi:hypothetical protein
LIYQSKIDVVGGCPLQHDLWKRGIAFADSRSSSQFMCEAKVSEIKVLYLILLYKKGLYSPSTESRTINVKTDTISPPLIAARLLRKVEFFDRRAK